MPYAGTLDSGAYKESAPLFEKAPLSPEPIAPPIPADLPGRIRFGRRCGRWFLRRLVRTSAGRESYADSRLGTWKLSSQLRWRDSHHSRDAWSCAPLVHEDGGSVSAVMARVRAEIESEALLPEWGSPHGRRGRFLRKCGLAGVGGRWDSFWLVII